MQIESEISVARPRVEVFDYIAHAEYLPQYVTDFASVSQVSDGEPGVGTQYSYKMGRGAEGTFEWTRFEPESRLAWHGPAVKAGPGSMEPAGWWELTETSNGTNVKLVMAPTPGGLFKLLAPFMSAGMRKGNEKALERLKQQLEHGSAA
ncbi:MAG TPA: SRPBCC family protein [Solirubrobacteraceae bacterium]|nr:SRPBCC family protein [Solirubrobacteraceae bacterium]